MNPEQLEHQLLELGNEMAAARAKSYLLEKELKAVYAIAYQKLRDDGRTQGDAQQMAYGDPEYRSAVREAHQALHDADEARVRYDALNARFKAWQSLNASRREQMKQGIY